MHKIIAAVSALGLAGMLAGLPLTAGAQTKWDMPTPYPDGNFHTQNIRQFADDIAKATGGKLSITVHSNQSLFKHPEIKRAVQSQQVPIGEVLISVLSNEDPVFGVDNVPFLATDYDQAKKLWDASRSAIESRLDKQGLMLLYAVPWPPQGLYTKKDVNSVSDLKGVKFRAYSPQTSRLAELMGAVPTTVQAAEVAQAFATGLVDAMVTSAATGVDTQAWDYVNHYYDTQAWLPKNMVIVGKRAFARLDPSAQEAVKTAAAEAEKRGWAMSRSLNDELVAKLKANGMTVQPPSPQLKKELQAIGETMTEEWVKATGQDGAAIIEKYRKM